MKKQRSVEPRRHVDRAGMPRHRARHHHAVLARDAFMGEEPQPSWVRLTLIDALTGRLPYHLGDMAESELTDLRQEAASVVSMLDTLLEERRRLTHETRKPEPDRLLSPEEAAKRFDVKPRWLRERADE